MKKYSIYTYPDSILRKKAEKVIDIDDEIKSLIREMFLIMKDEGGIGLAAPQIGVSKQVIVVSLQERGFERIALVNPSIVFFSDDTDFFEEGCLSIPGVRANVVRSKKAIVKGRAKSGREVEINTENLLARVFQHEIDHCNGVLFIDRLLSKERKKVEDDIELLINSKKVLSG